MSKKTSSIMKVMGATIAVCSAAAMLTSSKSSNANMKKTMKKTADKVVGFVDTVASMM
ncbi:MAG: hypothetical protein J1E81_01860 [Eubacterium sp.]|nr:hypothetical protein [Eubacterium sp.]